jgi:hypothetical protein
VTGEFDAFESVFVFANEDFSLFVGVNFILFHGEDDQVLMTAFVAHQFGEGSPEDAEFLLIAGNHKSISVEMRKALKFHGDSVPFFFDDPQCLFGSNNGPIEV